MSEQSTPVTLTPGVGTTQIQLSSALVENCQQRKCNFMENLNSSSNKDIYPSSPPQRPLPPRWAFRRAAADRPRPVAVGRSPAVAPSATDAAADATASEAARSPDREKRRRRTLREVKRRRKCHSEHTISPREGGFLGQCK